MGNWERKKYLVLVRDKRSREAFLQLRAAVIVELHGAEGRGNGGHSGQRS
jgi:hypothetical protein